MEINENDIRYKLFENQSGPTYFLKKSEIASILYESGYVDVFNLNASPHLPQTAYTQNQYTKYDLKRAKSLRNTGISFFSAGMALTFPIGLSLIFADYGYSYSYGYGYYKRYNDAAEITGLVFIGIGPAFTISGVIMWAVGQNRMNKINRFNPNGFSLFENEKVQLNLATGGNYMGLKLNF